eukprot:Skav213969  [mRNA]  locus=scaffold2200:172240:182212:+ [translate_table: standard]
MSVEGAKRRKKEDDIAGAALEKDKSNTIQDAITDMPGVVDQEPFLTSEEQDKLLNQLRAANFFQKFGYDNQSANWICANCSAIYTKAGSDRSAAAIEAASSHPEVALPFPSLTLEGEGAGMQEKAENVVGAALEVKKTTTACCSLFGMNLCTNDGGEEINLG